MKETNILETIKHTLFRSWYTLDSLEDRIYHLVLDVVVFASVISVVMGLVMGLPKGAMLVTGLILLFLIILQFVTIRFPKYADTCRIVLVLGLNFVFFPLNFFASGGIHGGMILFYLAGLYLCAILLHGNSGRILFVLTLIWMELSIIISDKFPQLVPEVTHDQHMDSIRMTLILAGLAVYALTVLIFMSYESERKKNEVLVKSLQRLSVMDALSGLYNRRELFRRLEVMYGTEQKRTETLTRVGHYIAMFDIDDFKKLNDTYGHSFGDQALVAVSKVLNEMVSPEKGELSARYGGEEFVSILSAPDFETAFERVDQARKKISELHWEDRPDVRVTISGGLISCQDYPELKQAMHDVDELLYKAKSAGKNRILTE